MAKTRLLTSAFALASLVLLNACSSLSSVDFRCDPQVNGGLALTIDVVRATEAETQQIRSLGEKWFYDRMREGLRDRLETVTFTADGSKERTVTVSKVGKDDKYLCVVADYKFQNPDPTKHVVVLPREKWLGQKVKIAVRDRELVVTTTW
jgi:hypothetical protein